MTEFRLPKYEPICRWCGHVAYVHTTEGCTHNDATRHFGAKYFPDCKCKGWERDDSWPPPLVVKAG